MVAPRRSSPANGVLQYSAQRSRDLPNENPRFACIERKRLEEKLRRAEAELAGRPADTSLTESDNDRL
jgi:hypothetical protein